MGYDESRLAVELLLFLGAYLRHHDLGALAGADGTLKLMPGLVRSPAGFLLQHGHPVPAPGQLPRHGQAEDSATDHHNMSHDRSA